MITIKDLRNLKAYNINTMEWYDVWKIEFNPAGIYVWVIEDNDDSHIIPHGWVTCFERYNHECVIELYCNNEQMLKR